MSPDVNFEIHLSVHFVSPDHQDFVKMKESLQLKEPVIEEQMIEDDLYNDNIVFRLYYTAPQRRDLKKQSDGETIPIEEVSNFTELQSIKNWRKILSNMYSDEFTCDDKRWLTLEHYIQGNKFKSQPEIYNQFTLESNSTLSKDPLFARSYKKKSI